MSSIKSRELPTWIGAPLIIGALGVLLWRELRRPLRHQTESKLRRAARNFGVAAIAGATLQLIERPIVAPLTALVVRRRLGLLQRLRPPVWLEVPMAIIFLDYTLYLWHVLTHRVPFLWRFHLIHHVDLDIDATTALRFHFGELIFSIVWRVAQILLIGISPLALSTWQTLLFLSVIFHHSNVELPLELERKLNRFIVTPRMHGIHHSIVRAETDANWSSGLTVWDWLHGTLRLDVPQHEITIGVPDYRAPEDVTLGKILVMPFNDERTNWRLPDGTEPIRERLPEVSTQHLVA
ncbi:MAG: sterol desaturase family protein [Pyrinomonadaceae bacterium]